jgi:hypothetical protein
VSLSTVIGRDEVTDRCAQGSIPSTDSTTAAVAALRGVVVEMPG